ESKTAFAVSAEGKQRDVALSPDNAKLAFTRDNNIYVQDLNTHEETQITSDGKINEIINGSADWVYEEELSLVRAFEWSPDGKKIAYLKFDESAVQEFTMLYYNNDMYPENYTFRYPKVGEDNAIVTLHVYDLSTGKTTDVQFENKKEYFPRINWTSDPDVLCVMRLNRLQNDVELTLVNTKTGDQSILLKETTELFLAVENTDWLTFLENGEEFLWASERDGWRHLYLYSMDGKLIRQITKGEWDVTDYYGIDEANKVVYYQSMEGSSINNHVYAIGMNGKKKRRLSTATGTNSAQFSGDYSYFVLKHNALAAPPSASVVTTKSGQLVRVIEDNKAFSDRIARYGIQNPESFVITSTEGIEMNAWKITPPDFDTNKEYPVLMYVYGGPDSHVASNSWLGANYGWFQLLAQQGYIVVGVDGRGTSGKGVAYRKVVYKELGKYETIDYIEAGKWLGKQSYVDADRIGIFGWSYGGFQASLCILKGGDVFKAALAVAPVTNWKWYDTIYTERYMQTLDLNESGYEDNSPINFADQLEGAYFIAHGLG
ncbi:MAG: S9 family peptidase, partial [Bacteroidota bacterium]